jgi:hypothetical protein
MSDLKVDLRGFERSVYVKDGSRIVAEVYTRKEPGDQYETAQLFATAPKLEFWLRSVLDSGADIPAALRLGARIALDEVEHGPAKAAVAITK